MTVLTPANGRVRVADAEQPGNGFHPRSRLVLVARQWSDGDVVKTQLRQADRGTGARDVIPSDPVTATRIRPILVPVVGGARSYRYGGTRDFLSEQGAAETNRREVRMMVAVRMTWQLTPSARHRGSIPLRHSETRRMCGVVQSAASPVPEPGEGSDSKCVPTTPYGASTNRLSTSGNIVHESRTGEVDVNDRTLSAFSTNLYSRTSISHICRIPSPNCHPIPSRLGSAHFHEPLLFC